MKQVKTLQPPTNQLESWWIRSQERIQETSRCSPRRTPWRWWCSRGGPVSSPSTIKLRVMSRTPACWTCQTLTTQDLPASDLHTVTNISRYQSTSSKCLQIETKDFTMIFRSHSWNCIWLTWVTYLRSIHTFYSLNPTWVHIVKCRHKKNVWRTNFIILKMS